MKNKLDYSYLKSEFNNDITLFIHGDNSFVNNDIDISIKNNALCLEINNSFYYTDILDPLLINYLLYNNTKTLLINSNAECISSIILPPLKDDK